MRVHGAEAGNAAEQKVDAENCIAIGFNAAGTKSNQVTLGNTAVVETVIRGVVKGTVLTVALLPSASAEYLGARSFVSDANVTDFASVAVGGGVIAMPVYCDGVDWRIG